jgi:hypothetical protein
VDIQISLPQAASTAPPEAYFVMNLFHRESQSDPKTTSIPTWTEQQMIRGCNLCIALYRALTRFSNKCVALCRIGSRSLESHFGIIRGILQNDPTYRRWQAEMIASFLADLEVPTLRKRTRAAISGVVVGGAQATLDLGILPIPLAVWIVQEWHVWRYAAYEMLNDIWRGSEDGLRPSLIHWLKYIEEELEKVRRQSKVPRQGNGAGAEHVKRMRLQSSGA